MRPLFARSHHRQLVFCTVVVCFRTSRRSKRASSPRVPRSEGCSRARTLRHRLVDAAPPPGLLQPLRGRTDAEEMLELCEATPPRGRRSSSNARSDLPLPGLDPSLLELCTTRSFSGPSWLLCTVPPGPVSTHSGKGLRAALRPPAGPRLLRRFCDESSPPPPPDHALPPTGANSLRTLSSQAQRRTRVSSDLQDGPLRSAGSWNDDFAALGFFRLTIKQTSRYFAFHGQATLNLNDDLQRTEVFCRFEKSVLPGEFTLVLRQAARSLRRFSRVTSGDSRRHR